MTALWLLAAFLTGMLAGAVSALLFFAEWANTGQARAVPTTRRQTTDACRHPHQEAHPDGRWTCMECGEVVSVVEPARVRTAWDWREFPVTKRHFDRIAAEAACAHREWRIATDSEGRFRTCLLCGRQESVLGTNDVASAGLDQAERI